VTLRRTLSTVLAALSLALTASLATPSAARAQTAFFLWHRDLIGTKHCLQPTYFTIYEAVTTEPCGNYSGLMWYFDYAGYGPVASLPGGANLYRLRSVWSAYCIVSQNPSVVDMYYCGNQPTGLWALYTGPSYGGYYELRNAQSGLCLQSDGTSNSWLWVDTCNGSWGQRFAFTTTP
jgi:hypothetical protein